MLSSSGSWQHSVDKSALEKSKKDLEVRLANLREQLELEVEGRKQAEVETTQLKAKYQVKCDQLEEMELRLCDVYQRLDQVVAEKIELEQQLKCLGGVCSENADFHHVQNSFPKTFQEAFHGIRSILAKRLDTRHGLLDELLRHGVLLEAHNGDICQTTDDYERADRLMNILERRRDSLLTQFYCALEVTDQQDLVQLIRYKGPSRVHKVNRLTFSEDDATPITGVTLLGDRIYIVFDQSDVIAVFTSHPPFSRLQDIVAHGLLYPFDIAASVNIGCLYVPDIDSGSVWRINVDSGAVVQWLSGLGAMTVSVTSEDRVVLLTWVDTRRDEDDGMLTWLGEVHVYSPEAVIEAVVKLSPDITCPWSVIMTTRKTLIVSHACEQHAMHRVCEVDMTGRVLKSFGSTPGNAVGQLNTPCHVSLDDEERVIVADTDNNRLLLLNKQLTSPRVLVTWRPQSYDDARGPWRLHYNSNTGRLLVGLFSRHVDIYKLK